MSVTETMTESMRIIYNICNQLPQLFNSSEALYTSNTTQDSKTTKTRGDTGVEEFETET